MTPSRQPPTRVPTLTEVVEVPVLALDLEDGSGDAGAAIVPVTAPVPLAAVMPSAAGPASPTVTTRSAEPPSVPVPPPAPLPPPRMNDLLVGGLRDEPLLPVGQVVETRPRAAAAPPATTPASTPASLEDQVTQRVLADLQRQVDLMLEYRLREVLAPALARVSDLLVRETRQELASTLRDIVGRAVAQELARRRTGR